MRDLYREENRKILKISTLDQVAVYPKPIERQNVMRCLKVFGEKTTLTLANYGKRHNVEMSGTVTFINKVNTWWTILNVKSTGMDMRKRQPLQDAIPDTGDPRPALNGLNGLNPAVITEITAF